MATKIRIKKAPSHYPFVPTLLISFVRSFCAGAVIVMICFFIHLLKVDKTHDWPIPFTFGMLLTAGLATFIYSWIKFLALCCFGLNPIISLIMNAAIFVFWTAGGGSLAYFAGHTLANACDEDHWGREGAGGLFICRIYKGLFAVVFLSWISTLTALLLDFHVRRKQVKGGKYQKMRDPDHKPLVEDDPWSVDLAPSPQPYQQSRYEPMSNHSRNHSAEPLHAPLSDDTSYNGAGGRGNGAASEYYDGYGAGARVQRAHEGP